MNGAPGGVQMTTGAEALPVRGVYAALKGRSSTVALTLHTTVAGLLRRGCPHHPVAAGTFAEGSPS